MTFSFFTYLYVLTLFTILSYIKKFLIQNKSTIIICFDKNFINEDSKINLLCLIIIYLSLVFEKKCVFNILKFMKNTTSINFYLNYIINKKMKSKYIN